MCMRIYRYILPVLQRLLVLPPTEKPAKLETLSYSIDCQYVEGGDPRQREKQGNRKSINGLTYDHPMTKPHTSPDLLVLIL
jgi:hypothetical protein